MEFSTKKLTEQTYSRHPFLVPFEDGQEQLGTNNEIGLSVPKVQECQRKYGPNKIEGEGGVQWYSILLKQISNAMILVRSLLSP